MLNHFNFKSITGIILGSAAGYSYWYFIGCKSGTCLITSVWYHSALYGAVMGYLLVSSFAKDNKS
jgi:hypothetical protein